MADDPFSVAFTVGTLDTDGGGHASNVAFPAYLEAARVDYLREALGERLDDLDFVVARLELDYLAELFPGDEVTVEVRTASVGTTSFVLDYRMATAETTVGEATSVQVTRDPDTGESVPVPDGWRERLLPGARPTD